MLVLADTLRADETDAEKAYWEVERGDGEVDAERGVAVFFGEGFEALGEGLGRGGGGVCGVVAERGAEGRGTHEAGEEAGRETRRHCACEV